MKVNITIITFFLIGFISAQKVWSFNDCLSYARENNLQVLASKLNEQVQESNYKIAKKEKLPDVTGTLSNSFSFGPYADLKVNYNVASGFDVFYNYKYTEGYQNNLALESSIILYNNGRLRLNAEKNDLLLQQNQYTTEKIKNDISLQLVGNYLTVLLNKELLIVQSNSMDTQKQEADRNEKLYNAGNSALSTLYESKSNLANAKQSYENAKIEVDRSLLVLAMLLQKDYRDFQIEDVNVSEDIGLPLINIDDIVDYAYNNQPVIKSAELGIEAAKKDIDIAKAAFYPTITGSYRASTYYQNYFDRYSKSFNDQWYDNHAQTLTVGVSIPIFNKGITKLNVEQSKINQLIQENQLDQEKLSLKQTIQTSYFDVTSSYQTFVSAKELVASTQLSYEFAKKSFAAGKINIYDLNTAKNSYFNAQSQMLQAKYSFLFRLKILDFYTGKPLEITSNENLNYNFLSSSESTVKAIEPDNTDTDTPIITSENKTPITSQDLNSSTIEPSMNNAIKNDITTESNKEKTNTTAQDKEIIKSQNISEIKNVPPSIETNNNLNKEPAKTESHDTKDSETSSTVDNQPHVTTIKTVPDIQTTTKTKSEEDSRREALIRERRLKLSQGSEIQYENNTQREAMIKERRAKLNKQNN